MRGKRNPKPISNREENKRKKPEISKKVEERKLNRETPTTRTNRNQVSPNINRPPPKDYYRRRKTPAQPRTRVQKIESEDLDKTRKILKEPEVAFIESKKEEEIPTEEEPEKRVFFFADKLKFVFQVYGGINYIFFWVFFMLTEDDSLSTPELAFMILHLVLFFIISIINIIYLYIDEENSEEKTREWTAQGFLLILSPFLWGSHILPILTSWYLKLEKYAEKVWWISHVIDLLALNIPLLIIFSLHIDQNPDLLKVCVFLSNFLQMTINWVLIIYCIYNKTSPNLFVKWEFTRETYEYENWWKITIFIIETVIVMFDWITDVIYFEQAEFATDELKSACLAFLIMLPVVHFLITLVVGIVSAIEHDERKGMAIIIASPISILLWETKLMGLLQFIVSYASEYRNLIWYAILISELFFEAIPQFFIEVINSSITGEDDWIDIVSILFTAVVILKTWIEIALMIALKKDPSPKMGIVVNITERETQDRLRSERALRWAKLTGVGVFVVVVVPIVFLETIFTSFLILLAAPIICALFFWKVDENRNLSWLYSVVYLYPLFVSILLWVSFDLTWVHYGENSEYWEADLWKITGGEKFNEEELVYIEEEYCEGKDEINENICDLIEDINETSPLTTASIVIFFSLYWIPLWIPMFIGFHSLFLMIYPILNGIGFFFLMVGMSWAIDELDASKVCGTGELCWDEGLNLALVVLIFSVIGFFVEGFEVYLVMHYLKDEENRFCGNSVVRVIYEKVKDKRLR